MQRLNPENLLISFLPLKTCSIYYKNSQQDILQRQVPTPCFLPDI